MVNIVMFSLPQSVGAYETVLSSHVVLHAVRPLTCVSHHVFSHPVFSYHVLSYHVFN